MGHCNTKTTNITNTIAAIATRNANCAADDATLTDADATDGLRVMLMVMLMMLYCTYKQLKAPNTSIAAPMCSISTHSCPMANVHNDHCLLSCIALAKPLLKQDDHMVIIIRLVGFVVIKFPRWCCLYADDAGAGDVDAGNGDTVDVDAADAADVVNDLGASVVAHSNTHTVVYDAADSVDAVSAILKYG